MWVDVECYALCIELLFKLYRATCSYCPSNTIMRKPDIRSDQTNAVRCFRACHFIMFIFSYADKALHRVIWQNCIISKTDFKNICPYGFSDHDFRITFFHKIS